MLLINLHCNRSLIFEYHDIIDRCLLSVAKFSISCENNSMSQKIKTKKKTKQFRSLSFASEVVRDLHTSIFYPVINPSSQTAYLFSVAPWSVKGAEDRVSTRKIIHVKPRARVQEYIQRKENFFLRFLSSHHARINI